MARDLHEKNRLSWNAATRAHNSHKLDQAGFLRGGGDTLFPEELALLGDVRGKRVLHLLCNAGQDSLGIARRGADVTGVDISDEAVAFATRLSGDAGIAARFERADVYEWMPAAAAAGRRFDVVFLSYGAVVWLSDLAAFAAGVAAVLEPGGRVVIVDFHPVALTFEHGQRAYDYFDRAPVVTSGVPDYVADTEGALAPSGMIAGARAFENPHPDYTFQNGIGDLVTSFIDAGLVIRTLREYPHSNGAKLFPTLRLAEGRRWEFAEGEPALPLMFAVVAEAPRLG